MAAKKTASPKKKSIKKTASPPQEKPVTQQEKPVFIEKTDRVIRTGNSCKNSACPKCGSFPTVTKIRRGGYELRRCRECEHVFEVNKEAK